MEPLTIDMTEYIGQARHLIPEMILLAGGLIILLVELFKSPKRIVAVKFIFFLSLLTSFSYSLMVHTPLNEFNPILVWQVLLIDNASLFFYLIFFLAGLFFLLVYWRKVSSIELFLALMMILGALAVVKTVNLLVLLLGIEVLSIGAYSLTAVQHNRASGEAAIKYIIFGGVSTAIYLFGISLLFGLTNTLDISSEIFTSGLVNQEGSILMVIFLLVFSGLFFKITAFPFHLWAPDVYEAVPPPLAAFFSVLPKLAVIGFIIKFTMAINLFDIIEVPWELFIASIAMITMTLGNLAALSQTNARRMMAYSSIAHTGFLLMAIVAFNTFAYHALLFYGFIYLLMNFGAFLFIYLYEEKYHLKSISDYGGMARSFPLHAVIIVIIMISLTGLPPTAGFTSKLFLFTAVWEAYQETSRNIVLVLFVVGILNSIISLFYYLKIPYYMIFKNRTMGSQKIDQPGISLNFLLVILVLPLLIFFIRPDILMDWINMIKFVL